MAGKAANRRRSSPTFSHPEIQLQSRWFKAETLQKYFIGFKGRSLGQEIADECHFWLADMFATISRKSSVGNGDRNATDGWFPNYIFSWSLVCSCSLVPVAAHQRRRAWASFELLWCLSTRTHGCVPWIYETLVSAQGKVDFIRSRYVFADHAKVPVSKTTLLTVLCLVTSVP